MNLYVSIKLLHILSATLVLGTGMGTAFLNERAMAVTTESVVLADWFFTTPAIVIQFGTGLWLTQQLEQTQLKSGPQQVHACERRHCQRERPAVPLRGYSAHPRSRFANRTMIVFKPARSKRIRSF